MAGSYPLMSRADTAADEEHEQMQQESRTYTGWAKIQPVRFEITWAEGPINEQREGRSADDWEGFNAILRDIAHGVPNTGGYDKVGFRITFADGEEYTGRYDVLNINRERPLLQNHVRSFVGFHSGLIKPDHLTDEDYTAHLGVYGEVARRVWYEFARKYDLGVSTPDDEFEPIPTPTVYTADDDKAGALEPADTINEMCDDQSTRQRRTFAGVLRTVDLGELLAVHESTRTGAITLEYRSEEDTTAVIEIR